MPSRKSKIAQKMQESPNVFFKLTKHIQETVIVSDSSISTSFCSSLPQEHTPISSKSHSYLLSSSLSFTVVHVLNPEPCDSSFYNWFITVMQSSHVSCAITSEWDERGKEKQLPCKNPVQQHMCGGLHRSNIPDCCTLFYYPNGPL